MEELNTIWLENCRVNFEMAIADGDLDTARDILDTMRKEGFEKEAGELETQAVKELLEAKDAIGRAKRMHYEG